MLNKTQTKKIYLSLSKNKVQNIETQFCIFWRTIKIKITRHKHENKEVIGQGDFENKGDIPYIHLEDLIEWFKKVNYPYNIDTINLFFSDPEKLTEIVLDHIKTLK
jgi:hypothetical protein